MIDEIHIITYCNEQVYSNYHKKDDIVQKLQYSDAINTIVGYKIWESAQHISLFSGFNKHHYLNGVVIGKSQRISHRVIKFSIDQSTGDQIAEFEDIL